MHIWSIVERDRIAVYDLEFEKGTIEWLSFPFDRVSSSVLSLLKEAIEIQDKEEIMNLWDGIIWDAL